MTEVTGLPPVVTRRVRLLHKRLLGLFLSGSADASGDAPAFV
ncbi:Hypothetical protein Tpal_1951 [Trichococcus palustris]|jgi:hypothetical protein|uniref:Uncharacterized protein n=1 Tax=Trichococcus palustris TaxID=140314 RepID=A0A143YSD7_9LACT|nr:Hypothetical protein Tpal_1951 [Trichococcus palustris]